jgi:hypothetical protein
MCAATTYVWSKKYLLLCREQKGDTISIGFHNNPSSKTSAMLEGKTFPQLVNSPKEK